MNNRSPLSRPALVATAGAFVAAATFATHVFAAESVENAKSTTDASRKIVELQIVPKQLVLEGVRDARSILVSGKDAEGRVYDLSDEAKLVPRDAVVTLDADNFIVPKQNGETVVQVTTRGLTAEVPVSVQMPDKEDVSFVREVLPVMSKVGCNQGACHGAQQGKNGFKLSLRGYDPLFDYRALVDDSSGRRFNRSFPSQSLILLKPTQGVPHEGGFLFDEDSRAYSLLHEWIAEGCEFDEKTPRVERLEVLPEDPLLERVGDHQRHIVIAHYPDGSSREVTREAVFETSNFEVATVSATGEIAAVRRGEASILVRYEGAYSANPTTVLGDRPGFEWAEFPEYNFIDTLVNSKLRRSKILPSELCTDAEFLRRLSLDLKGIPPVIDEVQAFLDDPRDSHEKRDAKIEEMLNSPEYVDHWTLKWSDLLLSNRKFIAEKGVWAFRNWIRNAIATNLPYDQFVFQLMTASGSTIDNPAANYYRIAREPTVAMENMTQVFLGTRFMCAQCHDHPFERWTQQDYYHLSGFFAGVARKDGTMPDEEIIYSMDKGTGTPVIHPGTGERMSPSFPYAVAAEIEKESGLRNQLAEWLTAKENPYFARSAVNRFFSYFTGRGIIQPVDDIRSSNPPSNPELIDALTQEFIDQGFDVKQLVRMIVSSHTYQRSYRTNQFNVDDEVNYSHAIPRRLMAEQLYDAVMIATGSPTDIPGVPKGFRATQLPDPTIDLSFLDMFGRAPRESPCECERTSEVSLAQTLNLINGPTVAEAIIHPQGRIATLVNADADPDKFVTEIYLATLCRNPSAEELAQGKEYFENVDSKSDAAQDLMWALINSAAFLFNR